MSVSDQTLGGLRAALSNLAAAVGPGESAGIEPTPRATAPIAATAPVAPRADPPVTKTSNSIPMEGPIVRLPEGTKPVRWAALKEMVLMDRVCLAHLHPGKKLVVGIGNLDAKIFFCGEAPGAEEEQTGEPFVGPAGQLLTRMIQGMGLKREDVFIGNIMNWRPDIPAGLGGVQVGNRPPTAQEMNYCLPYLRAQIEIVQPQVIVALGATAAGGLLGIGTFKTLGEIKGRWHEFAGKPAMVTYHPSYILRNNSNRSKRGIWEDLLKVMERAELPVSEKQRNFFL